MSSTSFIDFDRKFQILFLSPRSIPELHSELSLCAISSFVVGQREMQHIEEI